jgi:hypothetical protein
MRLVNDVLLSNQRGLFDYYSGVGWQTLNICITSLLENEPLSQQRIEKSVTSNDFKGMRS